MCYDDLTELFLVDLDEMIFLPDVELIGVPVGYCPVPDRHQRTMSFEPLRPIKKEE